MSDTPPAGWYPDPGDASGQRYWDGERWTEHTAPGSPQAADATGGWPSAGTATASAAPDPWLWQSIIASILCCTPLGVVGIAYAAQSRTAAELGDLGVAQQKATRAKQWTLWSAGVILVLGLLFGLLFVIGAVAESS